MKPPVQKTGYSEVPMQDTYDEWRHSGAAAVGLGCVDCHGTHAVTGARDVSWLTKVLTVDARAAAQKKAVSVTLRATGLGHAFPTGDPFRALRFELCSEAECQRPVAVHWLQTRAMAPPKDGDGVAVRFDVATVSAPTHWRLVYSLAQHVVKKDVTLAEREVELSRGAVH